jgi:hypothetical protein
MQKTNHISRTDKNKKPSQKQQLNEKDIIFSKQSLTEHHASVAPQTPQATHVLQTIPAAHKKSLTANLSG